MKNKWNKKGTRSIAEKYAVSERYVRQCLTGDRKGIMPDKIIREYKKFCALETVMKYKFMNQD